MSSNTNGNGGGMSRRDMLLGRAAAGAAAATLTVRVVRGAGAAATDPAWIFLFMRGGWDGLSVVCPYDDSVYTASRTCTRLLPPPAMPPFTDPQECLPLATEWVDPSGTPMAKNFGIPKALTDVKDIYDAGKLCFVHAAGIVSNDITKSHFDAMTQWEFGLDATRDNPLSDGWIARFLAQVQAGLQKSPKGIATSPQRPRSFIGAKKVAVTASPETYDYPGGDAAEEAFVTDSYDRLIDPDPLKDAWADAVDSFESLANVDIPNYPRAGLYPSTPLGNAMRRIAAIVNDPDNRSCTNQFELRLGHADFGSWDTHGNQGPYFNTDPAIGTRMYDLMTDLNAALNAFYLDMTSTTPPVWTRDWVLVCGSEFGRRIQENQSKGTDHGKGTVMLVMGNRVNGGKVYADPFPDLSLDEDVVTTTDYQKVLGEIMFKMYGVDPMLVFPSYDPNLDPYFGLVT